MGRSRYKILDDRYPYFITSSVVNGRKVFDDDTYRNIIIDGLNFLSQKREIEIYAYVIMPNHVHLIAKGDELGMYFARFKSFSARCILDLLLETGRSGLLSEFRLAKRIFKTDREHQFWCEGFHPKQISDMKMMRQKISYIHYNPVKAGLVEKQEDWKYSSYKDYNGSFNELVDIRHYRP